MEDDNTPEGGEQAAPETPADAPPAWDGALDTLLTQPWVPEDARPHLEKHLAEHRSATTRRDFLDRVFAEDDRTAALTRELDTTKSELASLKEALGKATEEVTTYRTQAQEAAADREVQRLRATYPDIFTEPDEQDETKWHRAWEHFYTLLETGKYTEEQAAKMARAFVPEAAAPAPAAAPAQPTATPVAPPPAKREVVVPKAVAAAGRGSASPAVTVNSAEANENFEQRALRMEREERARAGQR